MLGFRHGGDPSGVWRRGGSLTYIYTRKRAWCNRREVEQLDHRMADKEKDSERVPNFDGNAGLTFDVYEENILNYTAGKTDDRGWSCAD